MAVVPHGPYLLERLTAPTAGDRDSGPLLAVGDVDYDHRPATVAPAPGRSAIRRLAETGGRRAWRKLKGTGTELDRVKALARPRQVIERRDTAASAEQLLRDLPQARWAVLATHAFADDTIRSVLRLERSAFRPGPRGERATPGARNPLVLSGLVLAGANLPPARDRFGIPVDDGLVTAEAIAALPLGGLDLVALSACETALGQVAAGEGVFGLQRAFHQAGAKDVVAAMWEVDDQATVALMGLFHHLLWRENKPPPEALRLAQLYLYWHPERISDLAESRGEEFDELVREAAAEAQDEATRGTTGGERSKTLWWAGFILSGIGR